jgi:hypothetical protein
MDLAKLTKYAEEQTLAKNAELEAWRQSVGSPQKELTLVVDGDLTVTYGIWKSTANNPDYNGDETDFVMLIERKLNGYHPYDARYFPKSLVDAMADVVKRKPILQLRPTKIFGGVTFVNHKQVSCLVMAKTKKRAVELLNAEPHHFRVNMNEFNNHWGETHNELSLRIADELIEKHVLEAIWVGDDMFATTYKRIV